MGNEGHRQRLKLKFLNNDIDSFLDYEIIELLLTFSIPRKDTKPIAKELLKKFDNLNSILNASKEELFQIKGFKENSFILIKLLNSLVKLSLKDKMYSKIKFTSLKDILDFLYLELSYLEKENFKIIYLDTKNQFISDEILFEGTLDKSIIYPRELVKKILFHEAKSVIFVHNHPSGDVSPSKSDIDLTLFLKDLLYKLEIILLDHIIIGKNCYYSFKENNII
ncbi:DNA repair protein RadC [Hypnocyclicus thermotrophus]|uniref:DNA repair protein RadC n=1 Tax=Hypnocyclicus thermotrophus TaxID=1627895 RepID=A0AA46DZM2_9FUSO|nr:DNA repair protein RadC [Hypnocyclicus thermotrophus]TDT71918.1 DNA repair protein RadC [Hypnocyclicus thermotrophus]